MKYTDYIKYLKDNPEGYWFKRKLYGWGWVPVRWQGWLSVVGFVLLILYFSLGLPHKQEVQTADLISFFIKIVLAAVALIALCYAKGEKPKWQWGLPISDEHKNDKIK